MGLFTKHDSVHETTSGIHVESVREDAPVFKRVYSAKLDNRASIKIEMRNSYGRRSKSGELTQPNGRWIFFDPERVADKIIDPVLVPLVEKYAEEIFALDREFLKTDPAEFIDEHGCVWKRT